MHGRALRSAPLAILAMLVAAGALPARADSALEAQSLVQQVYYEGMPIEAARRFDARAVARLGAMLREPAESEHHANIVLALGASGHPQAFPLLEEYASRPLAGEVDRATFRARSRLAQAMGHLARSDRRALDWLLDHAAEPTPVPAWHFRQHAGEALALLLDEQLLTGLALSGADDADERLLRAQQQASGSQPTDERLRRHAANARRVHQRVKQDGPDALLDERLR